MHIISDGPSGAAGAPNKYRFNLGYIWMISAIAALGGLLFGYDWVVVGGSKPFYEPYFHLTTEEQIGWANSCSLLGCLLGSIISGVLSDRIGRKKLLILTAILFGVSSIFTGWATNFDIFVFWRILGGVAIGVASNISPTYIAEVAPAAWRGRLVTMNQLTIVLGILGAQIVNFFIAGDVGAMDHNAIRDSWQGQFGWRWMFTAVAVPSIIFFILAFFVPESPRWLMKMGKREQATNILGKIGGEEYAADQIAEIDAGLTRERGEKSSMGELFSPAILGLLLTGIGLAVLQQWSGTNVIFNYAEEIYRSAGYDLSGVMFNIVITGAINLAFTLLATATVDKLGRRTLMLWGCAAITIMHVLLGGAFYLGITGPIVLLLTLGVIAAYGMSLAPITWVLLSEIFPNRIRGVAMSIAVSALWIGCFIVTYTFPILNQRLGAAGTFWCYGVICLAGFIFIALRVPETKGKSLEEIEAQLAHKKPK
ncbi:sugar porter family MFS transporter [Asticcacaulis sp. W401b]|uniref:sugar porter family MFS transporter n=1 Tax=Asticcacaulis sp. W401b TaxID=3388666 RepID=UPI003970E23E